MKNFVLSDIELLPQAANWVIESLNGRTVLALDGGMGAGKTTLIKSICDALGVTDVVNSPTFAIVNEYTNRKGEPLFHFDLYRLNTLQDAMNIGAEDYFYSGHLCLIEWPDVVKEILPMDTAHLKIEVENGIRTLSID